MRTPFRAILTLSLFSLVSACSNQQAYQVAQEQHEQACLTLPPADYEDCMEEFSQTYGEYIQQREQVREDQQERQDQQQQGR